MLNNKQKTSFSQLCFRALIAGLSLILSGCQNVSYHHESARVREITSQILHEPLGAMETADFCEPMSIVSRNNAIRIALLNNKELRASYEELGIAKADLIQAGLFKNPSVAVSFNIPDRKDIGTNIELEAPLLTLTDLWQVPLRKKVFNNVLDEAVYRLAQRTFETYIAACRAYDTMFFEEALLKNAQEQSTQFNALRDDLRERKNFGFASDLDIYLAQVAAGKAELNVNQGKARVKASHAMLCHILGIDPLVYADFTLADPLRPSSLKLPPLQELIQKALENHFEIVLAQLRITYYKDLVAYEQSRRLKECALGIAFKQDFIPQEKGIGPYVSSEIPLFDQNQASIARTGYQLKKAEKDYEETRLRIKTNIITHYAKIEALVKNAEIFDQQLRAWNKKAISYSREFHKQMQITTPTLVQTQTEFYKTEQQYVDTLRELFTAYSELEMSVGFRLTSDHASLA